MLQFWYYLAFIWNTAMIMYFKLCFIGMRKSTTVLQCDQFKDYFLINYNYKNNNKYL